MKSIFPSSTKRRAIITMLFIGCIAFSFQDTPIVNQILNERKSAPDTIPSLKRKEALTITEYNKMLTALNASMENLGITLSSLNNDLVKQNTLKALESIDMVKMSELIRQSIQSIDLEKIFDQSSQAIINTDQGLLNREISMAMQQAQKELATAKNELSSIKIAEMDIEMKKAEKELEKAKREIRKLDISKLMAEASKEVKKASAEMNLTSALFKELEKDGLINTKKGFTIRFENKYLYINGIMQSEITTERYRRFFTGDKFEIIIAAEN